MKPTPSSAYKDFDRWFLHANTWQERKDGAPLELLDKLNPEEKQTAEEVLISRLLQWVPSQSAVGGHEPQ